MRGEVRHLRGHRGSPVPGPGLRSRYRCGEARQADACRCAQGRAGDEADPRHPTRELQLRPVQLDGGGSSGARAEVHRRKNQEACRSDLNHDQARDNQKKPTPKRSAFYFIFLNRENT